MLVLFFRHYFCYIYFFYMAREKHAKEPFVSVCLCISCTCVWVSVVECDVWWIHLCYTIHYLCALMYCVRNLKSTNFMRWTTATTIENNISLNLLLCGRCILCTGFILSPELFRKWAHIGSLQTMIRKYSDSVKSGASFPFDSVKTFKREWDFSPTVNARTPPYRWNYRS